MDTALQERLHLALLSQRRAFEAERMPSYAAFHVWQRRYPEFAEAVAQARGLGLGMASARSGTSSASSSAQPQPIATWPEG